jgi:hypothetical protein
MSSRARIDLQFATLHAILSNNASLPNTTRIIPAISGQPEILEIILHRGIAIRMTPLADRAYRVETWWLNRPIPVPNDGSLTTLSFLTMFAKHVPAMHVQETGYPGADSDNERISGIRYMAGLISRGTRPTPGLPIPASAGHHINLLGRIIDEATEPAEQAWNVTGIHLDW